MKRRKTGGIEDNKEGKMEKREITYIIFVDGTVQRVKNIKEVKEAIQSNKEIQRNFNEIVNQNQ